MTYTSSEKERTLVLSAPSSSFRNLVPGPSVYSLCDYKQIRRSKQLVHVIVTQPSSDLWPLRRTSAVVWIRPFGASPLSI
jgi:hypothetical protein